MRVVFNAMKFQSLKKKKSLKPWQISPRLAILMCYIKQHREEGEKPERNAMWTLFCRIERCDGIISYMPKPEEADCWHGRGRRKKVKY